MRSPAEVQAAVRDVGVALCPHRVVQLVQVDAVGADPGGVRDLGLVSLRQGHRQPVGRRVHRDDFGLVDHRVDAGRVQNEKVRPAMVEKPPLPIEVGMARTSLPLSNTLTVLVRSSAMVMCVADGERRGGVVEAVEAVTESLPEDVGRHRHRGARGVYLSSRQWAVTSSTQYPRPLDRRVGGDAQCARPRPCRSDRFVEAGRDDECRRRTSSPRGSAGRRGLEVNLGDIVRGRCPEGGGRTSGTPLAPRLALHGVGAAVFQRLRRLPGGPGRATGRRRRCCRSRRPG